MVAGVVETPVMATVAAVAVEVLNYIQDLANVLGGFRGGRTGSNNMPVGNKRW